MILGELAQYLPSTVIKQFPSIVRQYFTVYRILDDRPDYFECIIFDEDNGKYRVYVNGKPINVEPVLRSGAKWITAFEFKRQMLRYSTHKYANQKR